MKLEKKWKFVAKNSLRGHTEKVLCEYEKLYSTSLRNNPFFLYNYGAELNVANKINKSIVVLKECQKKFNDYDLQMLMADNYLRQGHLSTAIDIYDHASYMIPCRFMPLYQIFKIYKRVDQQDLAVKYAREIITKKVKIPSLTVNLIQADAKNYLQKNESQDEEFFWSGA